jgi:hypothetical protein
MDRNNPLFKVFAFALLLTASTGCGNWNIKSGTSGISETSTGNLDNDTGDIIRQEEDEDGRLRDCTVGNSSDRRDLPSCNDVVNRRESQEDREKQISAGLLNNKLSGSQLFTLPNGSKIRIKTAAKYNDENGGELIVNAFVERVNATSQVFEKLFFKDSKAFIEIAFIDSDSFAMLSPLKLPLNLDAGRDKNISYRKKFGQTTDDVAGISLQARVPIKSEREYKQLASLDVAFRPN